MHGHGKKFLKHFGRAFEKGVIPYVITNLNNYLTQQKLNNGYVPKWFKNSNTNLDNRLT
jgi:hypothetical protein